MLAVGHRSCRLIGRGRNEAALVQDLIRRLEGSAAVARGSCCGAFLAAGDDEHGEVGERGPHGVGSLVEQLLDQ